MRRQREVREADEKRYNIKKRHLFKKLHISKKKRKEREELLACKKGRFVRAKVEEPKDQKKSFHTSEEVSVDQSHSTLSTVPTKSTTHNTTVSMTRGNIP
jgi:hypothetical protein